MTSKLTYIDLFAGASGLSEGFVQNGYEPVAHIEMDAYACHTIKTRIAYHYLKSIGNENDYQKYLKGQITREDLYKLIPKDELNTVINEKISEETIDSIFKRIDTLKESQNIDLIIGGPPCQTYSLVGRSQDKKKLQRDERNYLFRFYAEFLKRYNPRYFVFENVLGLLSAQNYFDQMKTLFESPEVGYKISWKVLDSSNYGVLQQRKRVIIIGKRGEEDIVFPDIPYIENVWQVKRDLFCDLPPLKSGEEKKLTTYVSPPSEYLKKFEIRNGLDFVTQHITRPHIERDLKIYKLVIDKWITERKRLKYDELPNDLKTHKNQNSFLDRFKVVDGEGCSHTVLAHIAKDGHYFIYPDLEQIRSLSVREAARIQSFPDDFYFEGPRTSAFTQIGNAVPPLMAKAIAAKLKELL